MQRGKQNIQNTISITTISILDSPTGCDIRNYLVHTQATKKLTNHLQMQSLVEHWVADKHQQCASVWSESKLHRNCQSLHPVDDAMHQ